MGREGRELGGGAQRRLVGCSVRFRGCRLGDISELHLLLCLCEPAKRRGRRGSI